MWGKIYIRDLVRHHGCKIALMPDESFTDGAPRFALDTGGVGRADCRAATDGRRIGRRFAARSLGKARRGEGRPSDPGSRLAARTPSVAQPFRDGRARHHWQPVLDSG